MKMRGNSQGNHSNIKNLLREKIRVIYSNISNIKKITGILSISFGVILLINGYLKEVIHFINLGIGLIVVGWILLIFAYERYIEHHITFNMLNDYIDLIRKLIKELDIKTSGIVIPPRENLKDGCIYLPLHKNFKINLSIMDDNKLFVNSDNKDEMGLLLPPLGRGLRKSKDNKEDYKTSLEVGNINDLLHYLEHLLTCRQVGSDVKVEIAGDTVAISYRVENNFLCKELQREDLCRKCPCPVCGAILLSTAEFLNEVLKIESIKEEGRKVSIKLKVIRDVLE